MITQTEKLELCGSGRFITDALDCDDCVTVSTPADGFRMPSRSAVRAHDARLARDGYAPAMHDDSEVGDDDSDDSEESETRDWLAYKRRDSMREHSLRLPSQSSRGECLAEMRALGMAWES